MHNIIVLNTFEHYWGNIEIGRSKIGNDLTNVGIMLLYGYTNEYTFHFWCEYNITVLVVIFND